MNQKDLVEAAKRTLLDCMGLKKDEHIAIISDDFTREVGEAFYAAALELDTDPILTIMKPLRANGQEPPDALLNIMIKTEVLILATKVSLSHTHARMQASEAGVRCASMPGITPEMMVRTMNVDWSEVAKTTEKLLAKLVGVQTLHLISPSGSDMFLNVDGIKFEGDTGIYNKPGNFGNLPAGEACASPQQKGSTGLVVFDGSFAGLGLLQTPIYIIFKDGVVETITNGDEATQLKSLIAPFGVGGRILAEIGIGTHPTAKVTGVVLEDEKIAGTVHLALGNNVGFGGTNDVRIHLDGVILNPTLITDTGQVLIENGQLKI